MSLPLYENDSGLIQYETSVFGSNVHAASELSDHGQNASCVENVILLARLVSDEKAAL